MEDGKIDFVSDELSLLIGDNEKLKEQLNSLEKKYAKQFRLVGVITDQRLQLLATDIQILFRHYGINARIIANRVGDDGVSIKLIPPERTNIFAKVH